MALSKEEREFLHRLQQGDPGKFFRYALGQIFTRDRAKRRYWIQMANETVRKMWRLRMSEADRKR